LGDLGAHFVQSQRPEQIPVDLKEELHVKVPDAFSIEYRRVLQKIGEITIRASCSKTSSRKLSIVLIRYVECVVPRDPEVQNAFLRASGTHSQRQQRGVSVRIALVKVGRSLWSTCS
jgi:hypothetical protein